MQGNTETVTQQIRALLEDNPLLTASKICTLLSLDYGYYRNYVNKVKSLWKYYHPKERGSIRSFPDDVHGWRAFVYVAKDLRRVVSPWVLSNAKNRFLLFKNEVGRMEWFETGRVNLYVRKPASKGRAIQLFCDGFSKTELITDLKVLEGYLRHIEFKLGHFVFETDQRLPPMTINLFSETHGITIKVGDRSDPRSVEVIASYMNWAERLERKLDSLSEFQSNVKPLRDDYSR